MHISCTQESIAKGIAAVSRIVGNRVTLPILNNVLLATEKGRLKIVGTDLEVAIISYIGAKIEKEGSITVPARLLTDFISSNPDKTIEFEVVEGNRIKAASEHVSAHLNGLSAQDFPLIPEIKSQEQISIKPNDLREAITQVVFATALDETRPILTGVLCQAQGQNLTLAATDSYRLAERIVPLIKPIQKPFSVVIPARTLSEVNRLIGPALDEVILTLAEAQASFNFGNITVVSRILEGTFPDYAQIIPKKETTTVTLALQPLQSALKLASSFSRDSANNIRLLLEPGNPISVSATSAHVGDTVNKVDGLIEGEKLEIAFNARYLLDILSVMPENEIQIHCFGALLPIIIQPKTTQGYQTLVMPLRLDE